MKELLLNPLKAFFDMEISNNVELGENYLEVTLSYNKKARIKFEEV